jgi:hypothetical protein
MTKGAIPLKAKTTSYFILKFLLPTEKEKLFINVFDGQMKAYKM